MANIDDKIQQIRQAVYGKDVRESIASGIEAINADVENKISVIDNEVENTTARQASLETTFQQLIINAGNSNAEIVDARVKADNTVFPTLRDRLNDLDSYLSDYLQRGVNIEKYGAKQGEDSTQAFRDAISSLGTSGGCVLIPNYDVLIMDLIEIPDNVTIKGLGAKSEVQIPQGVYAGFIGKDWQHHSLVQNVKFIGFKITYLGEIQPNQTNHAISFYKVQNFVCTGMEITNAPYSAIGISDVSKNIDIKFNKFNRSGQGAVTLIACENVDVGFNFIEPTQTPNALNVTPTGIDIGYFCDGVEVHHNIIRNAKFGMYFRDNVQNANIHDNIIDNCSLDGIAIVIETNHISNQDMAITADTTSATRFYLWLKDLLGDPTLTNGVYTLIKNTDYFVGTDETDSHQQYITFSETYITANVGTTVNASYDSKPDRSFENSFVHHNIVKNCGRRGIDVWSSRYIHIEKNIVQYCTEDGIRALSYNVYGFIENNDVSFCGKHGITISNYDPTSTPHDSAGNTVQVKNNQCYHNNTSGGSYNGIYFLGDYGVCVGNYCNDSESVITQTVPIQLGYGNNIEFDNNIILNGNPLIKSGVTISSGINRVGNEMLGYAKLNLQGNGIAFGWRSIYRGTAAPTTGSYQAGDVYLNMAPSELGTTGNKYIILGWICVFGGTPGTWLPMKVLTGN